MEGAPLRRARERGMVGRRGTRDPGSIRRSRGGAQILGTDPHEAVGEELLERRGETLPSRALRELGKAGLARFEKRAQDLPRDTFRRRADGPGRGHVDRFGGREEARGNRGSQDFARRHEVIRGGAHENAHEALREKRRVVERRHDVALHRAFGCGRRVQRGHEAGRERASERRRDARARHQGPDVLRHPVARQPGEAVWKEKRDARQTRALGFWSGVSSGASSSAGSRRETVVGVDEALFAGLPAPAARRIEREVGRHDEERALDREVAGGQRDRALDPERLLERAVRRTEEDRHVEPEAARPLLHERLREVQPSVAVEVSANEEGVVAPVHVLEVPVLVGLRRVAVLGGPEEEPFLPECGEGLLDREPLGLRPARRVEAACVGRPPAAALAGLAACFVRSRAAAAIAAAPARTRTT